MLNMEPVPSTKAIGSRTAGHGACVPSSVDEMTLIPGACVPIPSSVEEMDLIPGACVPFNVE